MPNSCIKASGSVCVESCGDDEVGKDDVDSSVVAAGGGATAAAAAELLRGLR